MKPAPLPRTLLAACLSAGLMLGALTGCSTGATAEGQKTAAPAPAVTVPPPPVRTPTPSPSPPENRVLVPGPPPIAYRTQRGAAELQVRSYSWQRTGNGPKSIAPQRVYLVLDVQVTAKEGRVQVNPLYFVARPADGTALSPTLGTDGNEPVLESTQLGPGKSAAGVVTFDTPQEEITLEIYDEIGTKAGEIKIPAA